MSATMAQRRCELIESLIASIRDSLVDTGIDAERAEAAAYAAADAVVEGWAGQYVGIPADHAYRLSRIEREIVEQDAAGVPRHELIRRYGYTARGLRKLLARARRRQLESAQHDLFAPAEREPAQGRRAAGGR